MQVRAQPCLIPFTTHAHTMHESLFGQLPLRSAARTRLLVVGISWARRRRGMIFWTARFPVWHTIFCTLLNALSNPMYATTSEGRLGPSACSAPLPPAGAATGSMQRADTALVLCFSEHSTFWARWEAGAWGAPQSVSRPGSVRRGSGTCYGGMSPPSSFQPPNSAGTPQIKRRAGSLRFLL